MKKINQWQKYTLIMLLLSFSLTLLFTGNKPAVFASEDYFQNASLSDKGSKIINLVLPEDGAIIEESPTFVWGLSDSDLYVLYLFLPFYGIGYQGVPFFTKETSLTIPDNLWIWVAHDYICLWLVIGLDISQIPWVLDYSEVRTFSRALHQIR